MKNTTLCCFRQFILLFLPILTFSVFTSAAVPEILNDPKPPVFQSEMFRVFVNFPIQYEATDARGDNGHTLKVMGQDEGDLFLLSVTIHNTEMIEHKTMAELSLKSFAEALGATVSDKKEYQQGGNKGVEATMKFQEKYAFYRTILSGQYHYQLVVIEKSKVLSDRGKSFIDSFQIMD